MNPKVKIILVEDVETDALLAVHEIRKAIPDIELVTVDTEEAFREALASFHPDLVVTDYSLPSFDGMTALKITLAHDALIPVIIFTGSQNESIAVECIKSGAVDYVLKEQQRRLGQAVVNALKQKEVQRKKEEALGRNESLMKLVMATSPQALLVIDHRQDTVLYCNQKLSDIWGQPGLQVRISGKASAVFTQLASALAGDDNQFFLELQDPGNHAVCEKTIQLKGGNFIKCYTDLILGESGKCYGRLYTFEDVTREEEYARSLRVSIEKEKELNELKSKIVRLTSHEFKTPLASILMASETLQHYGMKQVDGKFSVYFERIDKNVLYMKEMIDKFLNLSRLESGHMPVQLTPADLVQFTREWLVDYHDKNTPSATILFKSECDECNMHMDTYLMEQVLNNLVSNGIKYSPEGSTVTIEVAATDDTASITITDQGIGIPVDEQQNVFSTFFRASNARKAAGTGLGLATVKQIVDLHGGRIGISSEENRGTQVKVELPLS